MALWRVLVEGEPRWARGAADEGPIELLSGRETLDALLGQDSPSLEAFHAGSATALPPSPALLLPLGGQEVWASGVTYLRSRDARMLESDAPDPYDRVYDAERPELFLKAPPGRSRGPGQPIGIRADSGWDVPEPELGLVLDHRGAIVGYVIGDDVSSRRIEGENPLYLPQAKTYDGSCALGPCIVPVAEAPPAGEMIVRLEIVREGIEVFADEIGVDRMRRGLEELASYLYRALTFPIGAVLLTGTGIVPGPEFTLEPDDIVRISITGLGTLVNQVERVGRVERAGAAT